MDRRELPVRPVGTVPCAVCTQHPVEAGLLCEDCREVIAGPYWLIPEQIVENQRRPAAPPAAVSPTAVLIDPWGRPHRLDPHSTIGRRAAGAGILVLDGSVSRRHAELVQDAASGTWAVTDLGSSNGTLVDDEVVHGTVALPARARLLFGQVGFHFLADGRDLPSLPPDPSFGSTVPTSDGTRSPVEDSDDWHDRGTVVGMRALQIRLAEPTGGGAGFVEIGPHRVALVGIQFELVAMLVQRMLADSHQPALVRGFVPSAELIERLSWDTSTPTHDHVKQLVRRVRRVLARAGVGDVIEARYRFGYRLRVLPGDA